MTQSIQKGLDYSLLTFDEKECLASAINLINGFVKKSAQAYLEIGVALMEVQSRFSRGFFEKWAAIELPWSYSTTRKLIYIAESFQGRSVERFQPSALYILSWPNVPQQAREYAFECVNDGQEITKESAKEIVAMYRPGPAIPKSEKKRIEKMAGQDPVREDIEPLRISAQSWENLQKIVDESRIVHLARNEDCEFGDVVYTVTNYPNDDLKKIGITVRRDLNDAIASAAGKEHKKRCYLCKQWLLISQFTYLSTSRDHRSRSCRDCENERGRKQKEKRKARQKVLAA